MDLSDRVVLVTGGSRGIGRASALKLAGLGAKVAVNYNHNQEAAAEVVAAATASGTDAIMVQGDVSTREGAEAAVKATIERWNRLDILVNNAGITRDQLIMRLSEEDWDAVLDTNLKGAYLCSKLASRQMLRARWGRIINISSVVGQMGNAGQSNYAAAKAGLLGLTKPGWIETDIVAGISDDSRKYVLGQIPLGRYGEPDDVAGAVAFLASDAAAYITGQTLNVDGGMVMV